MCQPQTIVQICRYVRSVAILGALLAGISAAATTAGPAPVQLGWVLEADGAQLGIKLVAAGATIYDGDRLETDDNDRSRLRVRLNESQAYLPPNAEIAVHSLPNGFSADLIRGTVIVSSGESRTFQLRCDDLIIRPLGGTPTVVQVTWMSAKELLVFSSRGGIETSFEGDTNKIEAGKSYRIQILSDASESESNDDPSQSRPAATGRKHNKVVYVMISAVAIATPLLIWRAMMSPTAPCPSLGAQACRPT